MDSENTDGTGEGERTDLTTFLGGLTRTKGNHLPSQVRFRSLTRIFTPVEWRNNQVFCDRHMEKGDKETSGDYKINGPDVMKKLQKSSISSGRASYMISFFRVVYVSMLCVCESYMCSWKVSKEDDNGVPVQVSQSRTKSSWGRKREEVVWRRGKYRTKQVRGNYY